MRIFTCVFLIFLGLSFIDGNAINQLAFSAKKTRRVAVVNLIKNDIKGIINFTQERIGSPIVIRGVINGLPMGKYSIYLHENGDESTECKNLGAQLKFAKVDKRFQKTNLARLGFIESNSRNKAVISLMSRFATISGLNNIINRGIAIQNENYRNPSIIMCGTISLIPKKRF